MERTLAILSLMALLFIILSGCTDKTNPTGNNWSNQPPQSFVDDSGFDLGFSYKTQVSVKGDETNLLCGDFDGTQSVIVTHFSALPDSFQIPTTRAYADSTWLQLTVIRQRTDAGGPTVLTLYKLDQFWKEDAAQDVLDANMTQIGSPFELPDSVSTAGTDVRIPIPISVLNDLNAANKDSLSIAVKCNPGFYAEVRSRSTGRGPLLNFNYRAIDASGVLDTTDSKYSSRAVKDSYRIPTYSSEVLADELYLSNLLPWRMFVRWVDNWNLFKDQDGVTLSEARRKQVTINKAELVFYVEDNPYYGSGVQYSLLADRVESDSVTAPMEILPAHVTAGNLSTTTFVKDDIVVVDITAQMQGFVNGKKTNRGLVIRSGQELQNYGTLRLKHFLNAPAGQKPKLRVIYTLPWL